MIIITGIYPPEKCGVGDYTYNLIHTNSAKDWKLLYFKDWSIKALRHIIKTINSYDDEWICLQYPCVGFNKHITAELLCLYYGIFYKKKKLCVAVHEYSQFAWKRRTLANLIMISADKFIFTTQIERHNVTQRFKSIATKSTVIKILSNIASYAPDKQISERKYSIGYFGFISPNKGIEKYIEDISCVKKKYSNISAFIMGQIQAEQEEYANRIINKAKENGIETFINYEADKVAEILSDTKFAYLPFPDGVSERRGSLLACMSNGCAIISTRGKYTTRELEQSCIIVDEEDSVRKIEDVLTSKKETHEMWQNESTHYMKNLPKSWDEIATKYNEFISC